MTISAVSTRGAAPPSREVLEKELGQLREKGLPKLKTLNLPALTATAQAVTGDDGLDSGVTIEQLLRQAVERLGGGPYGEAAACLFGLEGGTRGLGPRERREQAADALGMSAETFRTRHQKGVVGDLAGQMLALLNERQLRDVHGQLERRHPAESRLAVEWVSRFEAYYRLWTNVTGLAGDLSAYRSTLFEPGRPYDRAPGTDGDDDPGYSQEAQAEGYAQDALFHYTSFEWGLKQFVTRYGGLWLFSSAEAEAAAAAAVYRISWHVSAYNERDQSLLRSVLSDTRSQELHDFLRNLARNPIGQETYREWLVWLGECGCTWRPADTEQEYFPTWRHHEGIEESCQVHKVIAACGDYCDLIDREWLRIADWYHLDQSATRGVSGEKLYRGWRTAKSE